MLQAQAGSTGARHVGKSYGLVGRPFKSGRRREDVHVVYERVMANRTQLSVLAICKILRVSHSGYCDWLERQARAQAQANAVLLEQIRRVHAVSDATDGVPCSRAELADRGIKTGNNRIASVMRANGLRGVSLCRGWGVTTQRDKERRPAPDLAQREFTPPASTSCGWPT